MEAVTAELDRLGASTALAVLGTPEVAIDDKRMRVVLRSRDGSVIGDREVVAPDDCHERASVAAVFIAAWVGVWSTEPVRSGAPRKAEVAPPSTAVQTHASTSSRAVDVSRQEVAQPPAYAAELPSKEAIAPPTPAPVAPTSGPRPPAESIPTLPPSSPPRGPEPGTPAQLKQRLSQLKQGPSVEAAGLAFGTHDGNAAALGGGLLAGYRLGKIVAVAALVETVTTRQATLGPGAAEYRTSRLGVGLCMLHTWSRVFLEAGLFPELTVFTGSGQRLFTKHSATTWGAALDLRGRLGFAFGRLLPFVFVGGSAMLRAERLTLDDSTQNTTLSRWDLSAGAGLAFLLGGTNR